MQELSILGGEQRASGMALGVPGWSTSRTFTTPRKARRGAIHPTSPPTTSATHTAAGMQFWGYYGTILRAAVNADAVTLGGVPTLFGEVGLRFNINDNAAFKTGDFSAQEAHARLLFDALTRR